MRNFIRVDGAAAALVFDVRELNHAVGMLAGLGYGPRIQSRLRQSLRNGLKRARVRAVMLMRRQSGFGRAIYGGRTKKARNAFRSIWIVKPERVNDLIVSSGLQAFGPAALIEGGGRTPPHMIWPSGAPRGLKTLGSRAKRAGAGRGGLPSAATIGRRARGKRGTRRWSRSAVLSIPGIGARRWVRHPGSRVRKSPFLEKAINAELRGINAGVERDMRALVQEVVDKGAARIAGRVAS